MKKISKDFMSQFNLLIQDLIAKNLKINPSIFENNN